MFITESDYYDKRYKESLTWSSSSATKNKNEDKEIDKEKQEEKVETPKSLRNYLLNRKKEMNNE